LRQGFLGAQADRQLLSENFGSIITGAIPLFRGIVFLLKNRTPIQQNAVIQALSDAVTIDTSVFSTALHVKQKIIKPSIDEFNEIFENYYVALEKLERIVDAITF
jgi:hypothetical protein